MQILQQMAASVENFFQLLYLIILHAGFPCTLPGYETFVYHVRDYYVQNHYKLCEQNTD